MYKCGIVNVLLLLLYLEKCVLISRSLLSMYRFTGRVWDDFVYNTLEVNTYMHWGFIDSCCCFNHFLVVFTEVSEEQYILYISFVYVSDCYCWFIQSGMLHWTFSGYVIARWCWFRLMYLGLVLNYWGGFIGMYWNLGFSI